jgi:cytochrome P450
MQFPADPIAAASHPDPYPYYARMTAERPFHRNEALGFWVAADAERVVEVLGSEAGSVRPAAEPVPRGILGSPVGAFFGSLVRMTDGDAQRRMKAALGAALAAVTDREVAEAAERAMRQLTAAAGGSPSGAALDRIALHLPVATIAALLGLKETAQAETTSAVADLVAAMAPTASAERVARGSVAVERLRSLLDADHAGEAPLRRRLRAEAERADCNPTALAANAVGFFTQAFEATAALFGNCLIALAREPSAAHAVAAEPPLWPRFVAEVLRFDAPVQNTRRFMASNTVIAGERIPAGDAILVLLAAANRDPKANDRPDLFRLDRTDPVDFTLGSGRHACPGRRITVTSVAAGLGVLVPALGDLDGLVAGLCYRPLPNIRLPCFAATESS